MTAPLQLLDLHEFVDRAFSTLSGGERQRVLLVHALVRQPRFLVLDEPTNHLDLRHQVALLSLVCRIGGSVIATLHDLTLAAMACDRLALMNGGRIIALGTPEKVLTRARIREVYGLDTIMQQHPARGILVVLPA